MRRVERWTALAGLTLLAGACTPGLPGVHGGAGTPPAPNRSWVAPPKALAETATDSLPPRGAVPPDLADRLARLTLTDVVDLALRNNPATRASWAAAREAAAVYGSARGEWFPTIDVNGNYTRLKSVASQGRTAVEQSVYGPSATVSWLLLDIGGRSGRIDAARQSLVAADWTHNATIQTVVLQVQSAFFNYVAQRSLLDAQRASLAEADTNLIATDARRRAGVATVADVLQARTAAAQARLAVEQTEGDRHTARGALALALGYPANLPYDIDSTAGIVPVQSVADSVDVLIDRAVSARPDLAALRAELLASRADVRAIRGARLPTLNLNAQGGRTYTSTLPDGGNNYTLAFGLTIPIFSGFTAEYNQKAAEARVQQAMARLDALRQQVAFQVYQSYYNLQTASQRVRTTDDLLASASQSTDAARARYKEGVGSILDLLTAQSALASARAQQVQARLTWLTALAQLSRDTGLLDERGQYGIRLRPDTTTVEPPR